MKILHTTDLHFTEDWFKFIKSIEPEYDLICITGDFLDGDKGIISPKYVLSGHIHNPMDTKFKLKDIIIYNPGCDKNSKMPKIITIDI